MYVDQKICQLSDSIFDPQKLIIPDLLVYFTLQNLPPFQIMSHLTLITTSNSEIEILLRKVLKSATFKGGDGDSNKRASKELDGHTMGSKGQGDGAGAKENR